MKDKSWFNCNDYYDSFPRILAVLLLWMIVLGLIIEKV